MLRIFLCSFYLCFAAANIISLDNFKLAEKSLQNKNRFVFSDFTNLELRNASVHFDMSFTPENYKTDDDKLKVFVIVAKS